MRGKHGPMPGAHARPADHPLLSDIGDLILRETVRANSDRACSARMNVVSVEAMWCKTFIDFIIACGGPTQKGQTGKPLGRDACPLADPFKECRSRSAPPPDVSFRLDAEPVSREDDRRNAHPRRKTKQPGRQSFVGRRPKVYRHSRPDRRQVEGVNVVYRCVKAPHDAVRRAQ